MWLFDRLALELLVPLAVWVLASGLDDLVIDLSWFWLLLRSRLRPRRAPNQPADPTTEPRIAIIVGGLKGSIQHFTEKEEWMQRKQREQKRQRRSYTAAECAEVWDRWGRGESSKMIARVMGRGASVYSLLLSSRSS
jgi:hypothetical protein